MGYSEARETQAAGDEAIEERRTHRIEAVIGSVASANRAANRRRTAKANPRQHFTKLNRSGSIDSQLSLDVLDRLRDSGKMIFQPYHLYVERTDAKMNMARFYAMSIEPTLFGEVCLMRRWGRIGTRGQTKVHHFELEKHAVEMFLNILWQKRRRGYRTIRSNPRIVSAMPAEIPDRSPASNAPPVRETTN